MRIGSERETRVPSSPLQEGGAAEPKAAGPRLPPGRLPVHRPGRKWPDSTSLPLTRRVKRGEGLAV